MSSLHFAGTSLHCFAVCRSNSVGQTQRTASRRVHKCPTLHYISTIGLCTPSGLTYNSPQRFSPWNAPLASAHSGLPRRTSIFSVPLNTRLVLTCGVCSPTFDSLPAKHSDRYCLSTRANGNGDSKHVHDSGTLRNGLYCNWDRHGRFHLTKFLQNLFF